MHACLLLEYVVMDGCLNNRWRVKDSYRVYYRTNLCCICICSFYLTLNWCYLQSVTAAVCFFGFYSSFSSNYEYNNNIRCSWIMPRYALQWLIIRIDTATISNRNTASWTATGYLRVKDGFLLRCTEWQSVKKYSHYGGRRAPYQ